MESYFNKINVLNVYSQASSSMCGYHALHNAKIWLESKLRKTDHADFVNEDNYWTDFHNWKLFLLKNASDQAQTDFMNDYLWTPIEINSNVLETCYGEFLIKNHSDFASLSQHVTFLPELSYLHSNLMEVERVKSISTTISQIKNRILKFHAFVVSGGPNHWISLFIDKSIADKTEISVADSSLFTGLPKIVNQFIKCLTSQKSFGELFLESIVTGLMKEYQEEALKLIFMPSSESNSSSHEAEQLAALKSISHSLNEVKEKIEQVNEKSCDLDELLSEFLTNLVNERSSRVAKLNEELFQMIPGPDHAVHSLAWDFMKEISYGDCIVARGLQYYWTENQISLKNYQLDEIPPLLLKQTNLQQLILTQNRLKDLPSMPFSHLQALDLSCNRLSVVPKAVFELVKLQSLNLSSNKLTKIEADINNLTNLNQLSFSDNKISELPTRMELPNLEKIFGAKNSITDQFWDSIAPLTQLLSIEMGNNKMTSLGSVEHFSVLRILIAADNPFMQPYTSEELKAKLPNIQVIHL